MNRTAILVSGGSLSFVVAIVLAFDDNISELSPLFFIGSLGCFGWLIFQKTKRAAAPDAPPTHWLLKVSAGVGIAGLAGIALSIIGLFAPALEELMAAGVIGVLLLIVAVLLRIVSGMLTKRVDAATGTLSISVIVVLLVVIAVVALVSIAAYAILEGFGLM